MLLKLDHTLSGALFRAGTRVPRPFWKFLEYTGDGLVWLALCFLFLAVPATPPAARHLWVNFLAGLLLDLAEVGAMKALVRRPRPRHNALARDMHLVVAVDAFSFPSGHSSRVSFVSLFLATVVLGESDRIALAAAVAWALTVAVSRCVMGRHYASDVVTGLAVGVLTLGLVTQVRLSGKRGFWVCVPSVKAHRRPPVFSAAGPILKGWAAGAGMGGGRGVQGAGRQGGGLAAIVSQLRGDSRWVK
jgi:membrane-associated phospholipid phosphatase